MFSFLFLLLNKPISRILYFHLSPSFRFIQIFYFYNHHIGFEAILYFSTMHHLKTIVFHILSALLFPFTVMYLMMCFPPHIIEVFQKLRQTHYPHKCRKILGCNLVKRNLHPVAELVDYPFLIAAQFHGTIKLFFDLRKSRLRIGGGTVSNMILPYILDNTIQIIINRVLKSHSSVPDPALACGHRGHSLPAHDCGLLPAGWPPKSDSFG